MILASTLLFVVLFTTASDLVRTIIAMDRE